MRVIAAILAVILLTIVTQIGGVALLIALFLAKRYGRRNAGPWRSRGEILGFFAASYTVMTVFLVPPLATFFGRVPLACGFSAANPYAAGHSIYCLLNRNYVDQRLKSLLESLALYMEARHPGTITLYLDANFPFYDGFPLLPHLSHDDGRKLDLAFYYADESRRYLPGVLKSPIGYWGFEQPGSGKGACSDKAWLSLRWDMDWLQPLLPDLRLDEERTASAMRWLIVEGKEFGVERLLLEPHLAGRLGLSSPLLRFQGCRAARHDDHVHVQIR